MKTCPQCGKTHRTQESALPCYREVRFKTDFPTIKGAATEEEQKLREEMNDYFFGLPLALKH